VTPPKHDEPIISTEDGIQIDTSDEHPENARSSIRRTFEPDSNITDESETQPRKHSRGTISTNAGMHIDSSDEQFENACDLIT
jgi:hypothetical protein